MESATILTPPPPLPRALTVFCFPSEPNNIPDGPEYEKIIITISMPGEKFYQLHTEKTTAVATSK